MLYCIRLCLWMIKVGELEKLANNNVRCNNIERGLCACKLAVSYVLYLR